MTLPSSSPAPRARQTAILALLREHGEINTTTVIDQLHVSRMTVRRDLVELERAGLVDRAYGGAVLRRFGGPRVRGDERPTEVDGAAARAAARVHSAVVFLDSSPTAGRVARELVARRASATVITNSLPVMLTIAHAGVGALRLIGLPGMLDRATRSYVGPQAAEVVRQYYAAAVILGVSEAPSAEDAAVKRAMLERAERVILPVGPGDRRAARDVLAAALAPYPPAAAGALALVR